ncbi:hypothetical protein [Clostridium cagae]|uniref:hypothetical protein n=1 Tax=Clostridium cagae TaxID=2080751 RepID=UPI000CF62326|nr:hypothetical protein [Clostridium cagae]
MKKIFTKFNDLRQKDFAIKTSICEENSKKFVVKEAIFEQGKQHLKNVVNNKKILEENFPICKVCDVILKDEKLIFDYVNGVSLAQKYIEAYNNRDKEMFFKLINIHKQLVVGKEENMSVFYTSDECEKIFGDLHLLDGVGGLKVSNFEATAYNIFFENNDLKKPIFIDYEWVFDFNMPKDYILYQCILTLYLSLPELEAFVSQESVSEYLKIEMDSNILKKIYTNFYNYYTRGNKEKSLGEIKYSYLKENIDIKDIINKNSNLFIEKDELQKNLDWYMNRVKELEGSIKYHQANDIYLKDKENEIKKELNWYQRRTNELEDAIRYHHNLDKQLEEALDNTKQQKKIIEENNQELNKIILDLRKKIFEMENSRSWKWTRFFRKSKE